MAAVFRSILPKFPLISLICDLVGGVARGTDLRSASASAVALTWAAFASFQHTSFRLATKYPASARNPRLVAHRRGRFGCRGHDTGGRYQRYR